MDTTSSQIEDDVRAQIASDPRIPYPAEISAVADARRTAGFDYVDDWLQVRLLDRDRRKDAEIRGVGLQRLEWDSEIPADAIRVEAFNRVASLHGVTGVTNEIRVDEPR
jgi:osmotically-inducible protein OsmY